MSNFLRGLTGVAGGRVLIAIDFGVARLEAGFSDLAENLSDAALLVMECESTSFDGAGLDRRGADNYADMVVTESEARELQVSSVLGYCAGAPLAMHVANAFAHRSENMPSVILFDAQNTSVEYLGEAIDNAIALMGDYIDEARKEQAKIDIRAVVREHRKDLESAVESLCGVYRTVIGDALERVGLSVDDANDLLGRCRSYLRFLALASAAEARAPRLAVHHIVSRDHLLSPSFGDRRVSRISVSRADLLADFRAADRVVAILGSSDERAGRSSER